jgi:hypothetical protein
MRSPRAADDPRVERLARPLVKWQWPDGGWTCESAERLPLVLQ